MLSKFLTAAITEPELSKRTAQTICIQVPFDTLILHIEMCNMQGLINECSRETVKILDKATGKDLTETFRLEFLKKHIKKRVIYMDDGYGLRSLLQKIIEFEKFNKSFAITKPKPQIKL